MSDADDYEHALGGLRGHIVYGEQTAGDTPVAWVQVKVALPYLRNAERALVAERTRAAAAEADRDYWHAQATMAAPCVDAVRALTLRLIPGGTGCAVDPERVVAAVDGLRAECDRIDAAASRAAGEHMEAAHGLAVDRDAARADAAGLRAVVEGRTVPPTPQEIAAHHDASGSGWLVSSDRDVIPYTLCRSEARDGGAPDGARWWPLDASGRPCPWPTVALDAAGEGR